MEALLIIVVIIVVGYILISRSAEKSIEREEQLAEKIQIAYKQMANEFIPISHARLKLRQQVQLIQLIVKTDNEFITIAVAREIAYLALIEQLKLLILFMQGLRTELPKTEEYLLPLMHARGFKASAPPVA